MSPAITCKQKPYAHKGILPEKIVTLYLLKGVSDLDAALVQLAK